MIVGVDQVVVDDDGGGAICTANGIGDVNTELDINVVSNTEWGLAALVIPRLVSLRDRSVFGDDTVGGVVGTGSESDDCKAFSVGIADSICVTGIMLKGVGRCRCEAWGDMECPTV